MKYLFKIFVILFCSLFFGFSILILFHSIKDFNNPEHQINWKKETATIKSFKRLDNKQEISYDYKHSKKTYFKIDTITFNSRVAINKKIYVWLNPKNPKKHKLKREIKIYDNIIFAIGFSILPLFLIVFAILSIIKENELVNKIKIIS